MEISRWRRFTKTSRAPPINSGFTRFPDSLHRQRAGGGKKDVNSKKRPQSAHTSRDNTEKGLTESEEGEDGDGGGTVMPTEGSESNGGKVVASKAMANRGKIELVGTFVLRRPQVYTFEVRTRAGHWWRTEPVL